jgi:hypothetical protein
VAAVPRVEAGPFRRKDIMHHIENDFGLPMPGMDAARLLMGAPRSLAETEAR